jgi:hypothetical protein
MGLGIAVPFRQRTRTKTDCFVPLLLAMTSMTYAVRCNPAASRSSQPGRHFAPHHDVCCHCERSEAISSSTGIEIGTQVGLDDPKMGADLLRGALGDLAPDIQHPERSHAPVTARMSCSTSRTVTPCRRTERTRSIRCPLRRASPPPAHAGYPMAPEHEDGDEQDAPRRIHASVVHDMACPDRAR